MSLNPIKDKTETETRTVSVIGTEKDIQAMGDVLTQAKSMMNIDLNPRDDDMPERLTFQDLETIDAIAFPRTARVLKKLGKKFKDTREPRDVKSYVSASFGGMEWLSQKPEDNFLVVKALQSVMNGRPISGVPPLPPLLSGVGSVVADLENMIQRPYPPNMVYNVNNIGLFTHFIKPEWVKIQTADVSPVLSKRFLDLVKQKKYAEAELERIRGMAAYPADLTKIDGKKVATQGYYAAFRGNANYDRQQIVKIDKNAWKAFLRKLPDGMLAKEQERVPRTVGDLLETLMVVDVALVMNMKNATARPIAPERPKIEMKMFDWVEPSPAGQAPRGRPETGILHSTIVVGTGQFPGIGSWGYDVATINTLRQIPGWI